MTGKEFALLFRAAQRLLADAGSGNGDLDARVNFLHGFDDVIVFHPILVSDMWPNCQGPYISLPMVQRRTLKGSGCPFSARILPSAGVGGTVAVLHFFCRHACFPESAVDRQVGLGSEQSAKANKFMKPDIVRFRPVGPHRLQARRPLIGIAKTIAPVVGGDKVASRPFGHLETLFLEEPNHPRVKSLHIVGRHQRGGPDMKRAAAGSQDFQAGILCVGRRSELNGNFLVFA